jgi:uncharacterized protein YgiM (DUF1202 family)
MGNVQDVSSLAVLDSPRFARAVEPGDHMTNRTTSSFRHLLVRSMAVIAITLTFTAGIFSAAIPRVAAESSIAAGQAVMVVDGSLNLRANPTTSAAILRVFPDGFTMTVTDGPVAADGYTWYQVAFHEGSTGDGWVAGEYLVAYLGSPGLHDRDGVRVIDGRLNLRDGPGLSASVLRVLDEGTAAVIVSNPDGRDGYTWYQIYSSGFGYGWVAGQFLAVDSAVSGCEGGAVCPPLLVEGGSITVVTDLLNLRTEPSLSADVITVLPNAATATFTGNAGFADGHQWIEVETVEFGTGWVAREFVVAN